MAGRDALREYVRGSLWVHRTGGKARGAAAPVRPSPGPAAEPAGQRRPFAAAAGRSVTLPAPRRRTLQSFTDTKG